MMSEPRLRGFCGLLLGQPFYGWYRGSHAGGSFRRSAASSGRAGPGVGPKRAAPGGTPSSKTPQPVTPLPNSHLLHSTPLIPPTLQEPRHPTVPWNWSHCSYERNNNHAYTCTN